MPTITLHDIIFAILQEDFKRKASNHKISENTVALYTKYTTNSSKKPFPNKPWNKFRKKSPNFPNFSNTSNYLGYSNPKPDCFCNYCKKLGHTIFECRKLINKNKAKGKPTSNTIIDENCLFTTPFTTKNLTKNLLSLTY